MTKHFLNKPIYSLLLVLIFLTSCNGQAKTLPETNSPGDLKASLTGQPKLTKTQGSNEYQNIECGLQDKLGNIGFGTSNGICRSDGNTISSVPISFYIRPVITDNSYYTEWSTKNTVWSMLQDKSGKIWFGTGDGVYYYDGVTFARLLANDNVIHNDNVINKDSLKLKLVSDILEDKNGNIWFSTRNMGLYCYDRKTLNKFSE
jgi:outer membrane protein assembly factor BamB